MIAEVINAGTQPYNNSTWLTALSDAGVAEGQRRHLVERAVIRGFTSASP